MAVSWMQTSSLMWLNPDWEVGVSASSLWKFRFRSVTYPALWPATPENRTVVLSSYGSHADFNFSQWLCSASRVTKASGLDVAMEWCLVSRGRKQSCHEVNDPQEQRFCWAVWASPPIGDALKSKSAWASPTPSHCVQMLEGNRVDHEFLWLHQATLFKCTKWFSETVFLLSSPGWLRTHSNPYCL